ncbi:MAG: hypothetical protein ACFFCO_03530 [Promethearchaeota archaeon]
MARQTKKALIFAITKASDQVTFIEKLRGKIKCELQIQADPRGIKLTFRGALEQVRICVKTARDIFNEIRYSEEA